jgi:hypothetical protein
MNDTATLLEVTEYRLRFERDLSPIDATFLRGYVADTHREEVLFHHHEDDGSLRYDYPRVQFKVLDREALLVGVGAGGEVVRGLMLQVDEARLRDERLSVLESSLSRRREPLGEWEGPRRYRFLSPWLGLNQDNHHRYQAARGQGERRDLLARVLVGNCLSLAKAFGCRVQTRLSADVSGLSETTCRFKGVPMIAFHGCFAVNFCIPARLGVGKAVSRGFGTVQPLE